MQIFHMGPLSSANVIHVMHDYNVLLTYTLRCKCMCFMHYQMYQSIAVSHVLHALPDVPEHCSVTCATCTTRRTRALQCHMCYMHYQMYQSIAVSHVLHALPDVPEHCSVTCATCTTRCTRALQCHMCIQSIAVLDNIVHVAYITVTLQMFWVSGLDTGGGGLWGLKLKLMIFISIKMNGKETTYYAKCELS